MTLSKLRSLAAKIQASTKNNPRVWQPFIAASVYVTILVGAGLLYGWRGVVTAWVCTAVGGTLGFLFGLDFDRTQRTGPIRRMEREYAEQAARLTLIEQQNAALSRLNSQAKRDLALAIETGEAHYEEILRLRARLTEETAP